MQNLRSSFLLMRFCLRKCFEKSVGLLGLGVFLLCSPAHAVLTGKTEDQATRFVVVPGMREYECKTKCRSREKREGDGAIKHSLINPATLEHFTVASDPILQGSDIGQKSCVSHLGKTLQPWLQDEKTKKVVIYSQCQGTATALNYVAHNPLKISALVLEGVVGSGNRVIHWRTNKILPKVGKLPGSQWYLPYVAKCIGMFCYSPGGNQPVLSLNKIPKDLPIIIIHSIQDIMTPYEDALALYYGLRKAGNDHVYFITVNDGHIHLLNRARDTDKLAVLNQIYKKYSIPYDEELLKNIGELSDERLSKEFQPEFKNFQPYYEELISNTQVHQRIGSLVTYGCVSLMAAAGYYYCF